MDSSPHFDKGMDKQDVSERSLNVYSSYAKLFIGTEGFSRDFENAPSSVTWQDRSLPLTQRVLFETRNRPTLDSSTGDKNSYVNARSGGYLLYF